MKSMDGTKMRNILKTVLLISSAAPTLLVAAAIEIFNTHAMTLFTWQLIIVGTIGTFLPLLILRLIHSQGEIFPFKAKKVESNDYFILVFLVSYLMPLVTKITALDATWTCSIFVALMITGWFVSNIPVHPFLFFAGYHFYKVESDDGMVYTLLTKSRLKSPRPVTSVKKISDSMLME